MAEEQELPRLRGNTARGDVRLDEELEGWSNVGEAEARYRGARRLRPPDPRPLHNLGIVLRRLRRPDGRSDGRRLHAAAAVSSPAI